MNNKSYKYEKFIKDKETVENVLPPVESTVINELETHGELEIKCFNIHELNQNLNIKNLILKPIFWGEKKNKYIRAQNTNLEEFETMSNSIKYLIKCNNSNLRKYFQDMADFEIYLIDKRNFKAIGLAKFNFSMILSPWSNSVNESISPIEDLKSTFIIKKLEKPGDDIIKETIAKIDIEINCRFYEKEKIKIKSNIFEVNESNLNNKGKNSNIKFNQSNMYKDPFNINNDWDSLKVSKFENKKSIENLKENLEFKENDSDLSLLIKNAENAINNKNNNYEEIRLNNNLNSNYNPSNELEILKIKMDYPINEIIYKNKKEENQNINNKILNQINHLKLKINNVEIYNKHLKNILDSNTRFLEIKIPNFIDNKEGEILTFFMKNTLNDNEFIVDKSIKSNVILKKENIDTFNNSIIIFKLKIKKNDNKIDTIAKGKLYIKDILSKENFKFNDIISMKLNEKKNKNIYVSMNNLQKIENINLNKIKINIKAIFSKNNYNHKKSDLAKKISKSKDKQLDFFLLFVLYDYNIVEDDIFSNNFFIKFKEFYTKKDFKSEILNRDEEIIFKKFIPWSKNTILNLDKTPLMIFLYNIWNNKEIMVGLGKIDLNELFLLITLNNKIYWDEYMYEKQPIEVFNSTLRINNFKKEYKANIKFKLFAGTKKQLKNIQLKNKPKEIPKEDKITENINIDKEKSDNEMLYLGNLLNNNSNLKKINKNMEKNSEEIDKNLNNDNNLENKIKELIKEEIKNQNKNSILSENNENEEKKNLKINFQIKEEINLSNNQEDNQENNKENKENKEDNSIEIENKEEIIDNIDINNKEKDNIEENNIEISPEIIKKNKEIIADSNIKENLNIIKENKDEVDYSIKENFNNLSKIDKSLDKSYCTSSSSISINQDKIVQPKKVKIKAKETLVFKKRPSKIYNHLKINSLDLKNNTIASNNDNLNEILKFNNFSRFKNMKNSSNKNIINDNENNNQNNINIPNWDLTKANLNTESVVIKSLNLDNERFIDYYLNAQRFNEIDNDIILNSPLLIFLYILDMFKEFLIKNYNKNFKIEPYFENCGKVNYNIFLEKLNFLNLLDKEIALFIEILDPSENEYINVEVFIDSYNQYLILRKDFIDNYILFFNKFKKYLKNIKLFNKFNDLWENNKYISQNIMNNFFFKHLNNMDFKECWDIFYDFGKYLNKDEIYSINIINIFKLCDVKFDRNNMKEFNDNKDLYYNGTNLYFDYKNFENIIFKKLKDIIFKEFVDKDGNNIFKSNFEAFLEGFNENIKLKQFDLIREFFFKGKFSLFEFYVIINKLIQEYEINDYDQNSNKLLFEYDILFNKKKIFNFFTDKINKFKNIKILSFENLIVKDNSNNLFAENFNYAPQELKTSRQIYTINISFKKITFENDLLSNKLFFLRYKFPGEEEIETNLINFEAKKLEYFLKLKSEYIYKMSKSKDIKEVITSLNDLNNKIHIYLMYKESKYIIYTIGCGILDIDDIFKFKKKNVSIHPTKDYFLFFNNSNIISDLLVSIKFKEEEESINEYQQILNKQNIDDSEIIEKEQNIKRQILKNGNLIIQINSLLNLNKIFTSVSNFINDYNEIFNDNFDKQMILSLGIVVFKNELKINFNDIYFEILNKNFHNKDDFYLILDEFSNTKEFKINKQFFNFIELNKDVYEYLINNQCEFNLYFKIKSNFIKKKYEFLIGSSYYSFFNDLIYITNNSFLNKNIVLYNNLNMDVMTLDTSYIFSDKIDILNNNFEDNHYINKIESIIKINNIKGDFSKLYNKSVKIEIILHDLVLGSIVLDLNNDLYNKNLWDINLKNNSILKEFNLQEINERLNHNSFDAWLENIQYLNVSLYIIESNENLKKICFEKINIKDYFNECYYSNKLYIYQKFNIMWKNYCIRIPFEIHLFNINNFNKDNNINFLGKLKTIISSNHLNFENILNYKIENQNEDNFDILVNKDNMQNFIKNKYNFSFKECEIFFSFFTDENSNINFNNFHYDDLFFYKIKKIFKKQNLKHGILELLEEFKFYDCELNGLIEVKYLDHIFYIIKNEIKFENFNLIENYIKDFYISDKINKNSYQKSNFDYIQFVSDLNKIVNGQTNYFKSEDFDDILKENNKDILIENNTKVVSKEEIIDEFYNFNTFIKDNNLSWNLKFCKLFNYENNNENPPSTYLIVNFNNEEHKSKLKPIDYNPSYDLNILIKKDNLINIALDNKKYFNIQIHKRVYHKDKNNNYVFDSDILFNKEYLYKELISNLNEDYMSKKGNFNINLNTERNTYITVNYELNNNFINNIVKDNHVKNKNINDNFINNIVKNNHVENKDINDNFINENTVKLIKETKFNNIDEDFKILKSSKESEKYIDENFKNIKNPKENEKFLEEEQEVIIEKENNSKSDKKEISEIEDNKLEGYDVKKLYKQGFNKNDLNLLLKNENIKENKIYFN